jgi:fucose 4-O-acetylase-like acetyltransferase
VVLTVDKRVDFVDVAKGISIILVAFHHNKLAWTYTEVSGAMGLFRMPLFFFLSGVFFSAGRPLGSFLIHKTDVLLKPYVVTLSFLLLTSIFLNQEGVLTEAFGILYGSGGTIRWPAMWFLTHLWCLFVMAYILEHLFNLERCSWDLKISLLAFMLLVGVVFMEQFRDISVTIEGNEIESIGLPFSIDIVFVSLVFFLAGHLLSQSVKSFIPNLSVFAILLGIYFYIAVTTDAAVDFNRGIYREPLLTTLAAASGIYMILTLSYYISQYPSLKHFFLIFGSASLFILIFHLPVGTRVQKMLDQFVSHELWYISSTIAFMISITVPLIIKSIISKNRFLRSLYFPFKPKRQPTAYIMAKLHQAQELKKS